VAEDQRSRERLPADRALLEPVQVRAAQPDRADVQARRARGCSRGVVGDGLDPDVPTAVQSRGEDRRRGYGVVWRFMAGGGRGAGGRGRATSAATAAPSSAATKAANAAGSGSPPPAVVAGVVLEGASAEATAAGCSDTSGTVLASARTVAAT
jgi:hypothetical protein